MAKQTMNTTRIQKLGIKGQLVFRSEPSAPADQGTTVSHDQCGQFLISLDGSNNALVIGF